MARFNIFNNQENLNNEAISPGGTVGYGGISTTTEQTTKMSWDIKIFCFALCFALSMICSFLGTPLLFSGKFTGFSVMVSIGAVLSLISTCFLSGPMKQLKKMFEPTRLAATAVYLILIVMTFVAGLVLKNGPLALACIIGQYIAMAWYSLSYIPYARETVINIFGRCC